jgi:hypothetical protein
MHDTPGVRRHACRGELSLSRRRLEHQIGADTKMLRFDVIEADGLECVVISPTSRHDYLSTFDITHPASSG